MQSETTHVYKRIKWIQTKNTHQKKIQPYEKNIEKENPINRIQEMLSKFQIYKIFEKKKKQTK